MFKSFPALVAELSANHNGSFKRALRLIKLAKDNHADAVKLQTYDENSMTLKSLEKKFKIQSGLWKGYSLWKLYQKAKTPYEWHKDLFDYAKQLNIKCFSSAFDLKSIDFLEKLNCPIYKIASFESTDLNLIKEAASTKKPLIISTGLCNIKEIDSAYNIATKFGSGKVALLYCVSSYPANINDFNLENISILKNRYQCDIGFSDHSNDNLVSKLAIAKGATIFEKHIAEKKQKGGLDIKFSLRGEEIKKYKDDLLGVAKIIGKKNFFRSKNESKNLIFRRSVFAIKDIKKGERFTKENVMTFRPFIGLCASKYLKIIGRKSIKNIKKNSPLNKRYFNEI